MRCAFVVLLEPKSGLPHELEGWVEEVDTGMELRFHSKAELILFLQHRRYAHLVSRQDNLPSRLDPDKSAN